MGPSLDDTLAAFTNITPDLVALGNIATLRAYYKNTATAIHVHVPAGPERSTALTHLRSSLMFAIQAIVLDSRLRNLPAEMPVVVDNVVVAHQPSMFHPATLDSSKVTP